MAELLVFLLAGCAVGVFTGLCPGIHVNTVSFIAISLAFAGNTELCVALAAMAVVHSVVDFVPSILLGAPDAESFLSVLPGHALLMEGRAMEAIQLSAGGALIGGLLAVAAAPLIAEFAVQSAEILSLSIPFILVGVLALMIAGEEGKIQKKRALFVAGLSGFLGLIVLSGNSAENALFPLVTGFFGASTILHSVGEQNSFRKQNPAPKEFDKKTLFKGTLYGMLAAGTVSIIPSIGPAQAAFVLKQFLGKISREKYLVLLGSVGTANMVFANYVLYATGKARTGTAAAMKALGGQPDILYITGAVLFALFFGYFAAIFSANAFIRIVSGINYRKLNFATLGFLSILVFLFTGFYGIFVFATASSIGFYAIARGVKRINTMAFLMLPTILFYFSFP